jgi:S-formylglutathione hydrolase
MSLRTRQHENTAVWYLSSLTRMHANVTEKGEFRKACAELGLIFVALDICPHEGVPGDPESAYDFGAWLSL